MARKSNKASGAPGAEPDGIKNKRLGGKDERVEIVLEPGETLWHLCECKYDGRHPIAAVFQANDLKPAVVYENGLRRLVDPVYFAGSSYIFPDWSEIEQLEKQFYQLIDAQYPPLENEEAGAEAAGESTDDSVRSFVTINWDQTLYAVAKQKYGGDIPLEAIYEINQMAPTVTEGPAGKALEEPIYPGGKTYWLPARKEVGALRDRYKERVRQLMK